MTLFSLWRALCGLSQREAASVLGMSLRSVEDFERWKPCKPEIIAELRALRLWIERAADEGLAAWKAAGTPGSIDLGIAADDHEAQSLGWPCVGAQRTSLALIVAALPPEVEVRIVPRGSTPATAAAADAHGR